MIRWARDWRSMRALVDKMVRQYPSGVLVEEFIAGTDITVPFIAGLGEDGVMSPVEYVIADGARSKYNIYDYRLKNVEAGRVNVRCPAELPRDVLARIRTIARTVVRALGMRDVGRIDFRLGDDGRIYFLEVNALPSLEPGSSLFAASKREGLSFEATIERVVRSAAVRWGLSPPSPPQETRRKAARRIYFQYETRRFQSGKTTPKPNTIRPRPSKQFARPSSRSATMSCCSKPNAELPAKLSDEKVDLVFNVAEGLSAGRNREAQVPALCELLGIPYTGSDSATLALALDKALCKRILRQHGILTPAFQVMGSGREKLAAELAGKYPLIVKPNAEGSSKGVAQSGVVDDEASPARGGQRAGREIPPAGIGRRIHIGA